MSLTKDMKHQMLAILPSDESDIYCETVCLLANSAVLKADLTAKTLLLKCNFDLLEAAERLKSNLEQLLPKINLSSGFVRPIQKRFEYVLSTNVQEVYRALKMLNHRGVPYTGLSPRIINCDDKSLPYAIRGCFLACGHAVSPKNNGVVEFYAPNLPISLAIVGLLEKADIKAKNYEDGKRNRSTIKGTINMVEFAKFVGCKKEEQVWKAFVVDLKDGSHGTVNRVNFASANGERAASAARQACENVTKAYEVIGRENLPEHILEAGDLRLKYPEHSLQELIDESDLTVTKYALAGRLKKLQELLHEATSHTQK
ncbi:hypothetical protein FACS1894125_6020 [Actinomycetota bacterium]|nr:hypothetical protein FACS1894125_6020 [Actinomycetota bacterium]